MVKVTRSSAFAMINKFVPFLSAHHLRQVKSGYYDRLSVECANTGVREAYCAAMQEGRIGLILSPLDIAEVQNFIRMGAIEL